MAVPTLLKVVVLLSIPILPNRHRASIRTTRGAKVLDNKIGVTFAKHIKRVCRAVDATIQQNGRACITADTALSKKQIERDEN